MKQGTARELVAHIARAPGERSRGLPVRIVALAIAYALAARAGLELQLAGTNASPVWPASGVALAALLVFGPRLWPGVWAGAFAANFATLVGANAAGGAGTALSAAALIATGNLAEALAAFALMRRFAAQGLHATPHAAYVFGAVAMAAAAVSASGGSATLVVLGIVPRGVEGTVWLTWWLGDVLGLLVVTPFVLALFPLRPAPRPHWRALALGMAMFALAAAATFSGVFAAGHVDRLMSCTLVVVIAWAAVRHGRLAAASATLATTAVALIATTRGFGPFAKSTVNDSLVSLDAFLALCAITGLVIAGAVGRADRHGDGAGQRAARLPVAILLTTLATTVLAWHSIATDTERRAAERFAAQASDIHHLIAERMRVYEQALRGARGLFAASTSVSRAEWREYTAALDVDENYPGIQGVGFAQVIPPGEHDLHVAQMRADGLPEYALRPAGEQGGTTSIVYLEPQDWRNVRAIGFDMFSEPVRRAAMEAARDSGAAAVSGKVTLVQETEKQVQAGFLMYVPVYRNGAATSTVEERRRALLGYAYSPFRAGDLMTGVLQRVDLESVALRVFDGSEADDAALMFSSASGSAAPYPHQHVALLPLEIAGRPWTLAFRSTPAYEAGTDTQKAQIALVAGTLIGLLLFTQVYALALRRAEALELAQRSDAERDRAEHNFKALAESAHDAIVVIGPAGRIEFCNAAAAQLFARAPSELAGLEFERLLALPEPLERWRSSDRLTRTLTMNGSGGEPITVEASTAAWEGLSGRYLQVTLHDISQRVRAEGALREVARREQEANRAKSAFLATMSHEIRTPMNAVIGLTYLLERTRLDVEQARYVVKIKGASKSLLALINDILDLSKVEAGELTIERVPFDLHLVLSELADVAQLQAQAGQIAFHVDTAGDVPAHLVGDATRLNQVLTNLVSNAIKFTEQGGVALRVRRLPAAAAVAPNQVRLRFEVQDSGIGIAPEIQARLFAPFVQADASTTRRFGGSGLGLSIVKTLVDLMGGTVGMRSAIGEGSEFAVELAFELDAAAAIAPALAHGIATDRLDGLHVLVVDDSDINLGVAQRILEQAGARVSVASNGQEGCALVLAAPSAFDVVLMDLQMPVMDGFEATRRIRAALGPQPPIVALTASALTSEVKRASQVGMNAFITKPFDPRTLVRSLRATAAGRSEMSAVFGPTIAELPRAAAVPWPQIAGIDTVEVRERLADDVALFRSLLGRLLADFAELADDARALDAQALPAHAARMHKLNGSSALLGARSVCRLAGHAETAAACGDLAEAFRVTLETAAALDELRAAAHALLRAPPEDDVPADTQAPVDMDAVRELARLMRLRDLAALERFEGLGPQLERRFGHRSFSDLRHKVEGLKFDDAIRELERLQG